MILVPFYPALRCTPLVRACNVTRVRSACTIKRGPNSAENKNKNNLKIRITVHAPRRIWNKLSFFRISDYNVLVSFTIFLLFSLSIACTDMRILDYFCFAIQWHPSRGALEYYRYIVFLSSSVVYVVNFLHLYKWKWANHFSTQSKICLLEVVNKNNFCHILTNFGDSSTKTDGGDRFLVIFQKSVLNVRISIETPIFLKIRT